MQKGINSGCRPSTLYSVNPIRKDYLNSHWVLTKAVCSSILFAIPIASPVMMDGQFGSAGNWGD